jgi:hypothetical protein
MNTVRPSQRWWFPMVVAVLLPFILVLVATDWLQDAVDKKWREDWMTANGSEPPIAK